MIFKFIGKTWNTTKNSTLDFQQALDQFVGVEGAATITLDEIITNKKVRITICRSYKDYQIKAKDPYLDIFDKFIIFGKKEFIPFTSTSYFSYRCSFDDVENKYNTKSLKLKIVSQSPTEFVVEIEKV
jgi:hypothetical protein